MTQIRALSDVDEFTLDFAEDYYAAIGREKVHAAKSSESNKGFSAPETDDSFEFIEVR